VIFRAPGLSPFFGLEAVLEARSKPESCSASNSLKLNHCQRVRSPASSVGQEIQQQPVITSRPVPKRLYIWTRDLHLYLGLFISPFVLLFAVSVFFLNHARTPIDATTTTRVMVHDLQVPAGIAEAQGMERVHHAAEILAQVGVTGEINFIRYIPKERRLVIPVVKPGVETTIDLNVEARKATVSRRKTTTWETLSYLHKSPGPHNAAIRGNWLWTRAWRWLADATVYLVLFLSMSGIYLWVALKSERKVGLILLIAGAVSLGGIIYVVIA